MVARLTHDVARVVLYLDVDGVLSALSSRHAFGDGRRVERGGFSLTLSRRLGSRLAQLPAEIRWLTTWGAEATEIGASIGIRHSVVAEDPPPDATSAGSWKLEVVRRQVEAERRPFAWVDDEAIHEEAEDWAVRCGVPHLLLRPAANRGLSPDEVGHLEAFLGELHRS